MRLVVGQLTAPSFSNLGIAQARVYERVWIHIVTKSKLGVVRNIGLDITQSGTRKLRLFSWLWTSQCSALAKSAQRNQKDSCTTWHAPRSGRRSGTRVPPWTTVSHVWRQLEKIQQRRCSYGPARQFLYPFAKMQHASACLLQIPFWPFWQRTWNSMYACNILMWFFNFASPSPAQQLSRVLQL